MFAGSVWPAASGVVAIKSRWTKSWCWQHLGRDFSFATALTETPTKRHVAGFDLTHNYRSKSYHQHDRDLPFSGSLDRNNNRMLWLKKLPKKSLSDSEFNLFCCGLVDIHTHPLWGICSVSCTLCICSNMSSPAQLHTGTFCSAQQSDVVTTPGHLRRLMHGSKLNYTCLRSPAKEWPVRFAKKMKIKWWRAL